MVSKPRVFLDSSVLIAGAASPSGASRAILILANAELITPIASEQVLVESECNIRDKLPRALGYYQRVISNAGFEVVQDPSPEEIEAAKQIIHPKDAPILAAAMSWLACSGKKVGTTVPLSQSKPTTAQVDYLVTLNHKHFLDDPAVASKSGLRIGLPSHFLAWFRAWAEGMGS